MLGRIAAFLYGLACYLTSFLAFVYAVGFVGNIVVSKSSDSSRLTSLGHALAVDAALLGLIAIQQSFVSRPWFKAAWLRIVPKPIERSTYVLLSSATLLLLFWKWEPLGGVVWEMKNQDVRLILGMTFVFGWMTVLITTFLVNHFDLFGVRQVWANLLGRDFEPTTFPTPGLRRYVRHHLYLGFLLAFWSAPVMTITHLVLAVATTGYVLLKLQTEERDVVRPYFEPRRRVSMELTRSFLREVDGVAIGQSAVTRAG